MAKDEKSPKQDYKYIVRVLNTDLDGSKPISQSLQKIKGISFMFSNAILEVAKIDKNAMTGKLKDADVEKLTTILKNPTNYNIPEWLFNRLKDYETGEDTHLFSSDLDFTQMNDIKRLQKIKSFRGLRHQARLPVRGQRTKSNFRKGKSLGVAKKGKK